MKQFLELTASELLDEFGGGKHAPGSGSAAALIGLIAANLVYTVGQLTIGKPKYRQFHREVSDSCASVQTIILPNLQRLFQQDAEAFDAVYQARVARNKAQDERERERLQRESLQQQQLATAIPFEIAAECMKLIDISGRIFDIGFQAARGDTGVALSAAVAGVFSAVFVINLNLIPFKGNYWAQQRRKECDQLQLAAMKKYQAILERVNTLRSEDVDMVDENEKAAEAGELLAGALDKYSDSEIDERAAALHTLVWRHRKQLWADENTPLDPVELLDPARALQYLGYGYSLEDTLGRFQSDTGMFEVAGLLEAQKGRVSISRQMKPDVRYFTSAHELAHLVLHPALIEAHRDRPVDGVSKAREPREREADRFASSYLMPPNLVKARFKEIFLTELFELNDLTAFALWGAVAQANRSKIKTRRLLSFALATTERFNSKQVISLSAQFKVSPTAMAIRLEELGLLIFE